MLFILTALLQLMTVDMQTSHYSLSSWQCQPHCSCIHATIMPIIWLYCPRSVHNLQLSNIKFLSSTKHFLNKITVQRHHHMPLFSGHLIHTTLTCTGKCPPVTCRISVNNLCASTASLDLLRLSCYRSFRYLDERMAHYVASTAQNSC